MSDFMLVKQVSENNWLTHADFLNIGGILGLGLGGTNLSFWN